MNNPLRKRLEAIVTNMPQGSAVTLPVDWLRQLLDAEGMSDVDDGSPGRPLQLREVAERYGRSPSTIRAWCAAGKLPGAFKMNGFDWWIPRSALRKFEADQQRDRKQEPALGRAREPDLSSWRKIRKGHATS